jgi:hypothetical protein
MTTFTRTGARGHELELSSPLPESLAEFVPEQAEAHAALAAKLHELRAARLEAGLKLADQLTADERAGTEAALEGRAAPRPKADPLRRKLEEADAEVHRHEEALLESANELLATAEPHLAAGAKRAREKAAAGLTRLGELVQATLVQAEEIQRAEAEAGWIAALEQAPGHVAPFRPLLGGGELRDFRNAVAAAFTEATGRRAEREAEAKRRRREEAELEAQAARHREREEREDKARRVVTEGMAVVERGGEPVPRRGGRLEPEEGEQ